MNQNKNSLLGVIILVVTAMIWGTAFVAQVLGSDDLPPFGFNGLRFLLGSFSMLPLCIFAERPAKRLPEERETHKKKMRTTLLASMLAGCALFAASAFQQCGITLTRDPGKAGFITGLYTVLTPVAYWLIFKKKSTWNIWLGCILSAVGLYLICLKDNFQPHVGMGDILIFFGAFMWTAHILVVDRFGGAVYAFRFSALQYGICGSFSLILSLLTETMTLQGILNAWGAIFFCGVFSVGVAFTLQTVGQRMVKPAPAAIIMSTEAVFAAVGGVLWNLAVPEHMRVDQTITWVGLIGCGAMFLGIILSQVRFPARKKNTDVSA